MGNRSLDEFVDGGTDERDDGTGGDGGATGAGGDGPDEGATAGAGDVRDAGGSTNGATDPQPAGRAADPGPESRREGTDPVEPTYALDADGGACAACGERVARRWRGEAGLVCPDCKEW